MAFVDRTCSEVREGSAASDAPNCLGTTGGPLSSYAEHPALVLLAPAGAGKTVEFKREAERLAADYVTARNFVTLNEPRWRNGTLFIDALDEMRANAADGRTPLDAIRKRLDELGRPPFRLSCREADWFGANDRRHLESVAQNGNVLALRLDPLSDDQVEELLMAREDVASAEQFVDEAWRRGMHSLLRNPQTLDLLAQAVAADSWPGSRTETFEKACRRLAQECNDEHLIGGASQAGVDELLSVAGKLCAVSLLSGGAGYAVRTASADQGFIPLRDIRDTPQPLLEAALRTRLFDFPDGSQCAAPTHRQIAEFLAASYLARLVLGGLPRRHIAALTTGQDGGVVTGLRGLVAWLAALDRDSRLDCIERDPIGTMLYGDVGSFSLDDKRRLVERIKEVASRDPWLLRNRADLNVRWGELATKDAEPIFREVLKSAGTGDDEQLLAENMLRGLAHSAETLPLGDLLLDVARDDERWPHIRSLALEVFAGQPGGSVARQLRELLDDVVSDAVSDPLDGLLGILLTHLYPRHLGPAEVLRFLREPKRPFTIGHYDRFWTSAVIDKSTEQQLWQLLDGIRARLGDGYTDEYLPPAAFNAVLLRLLKGPTANWCASTLSKCLPLVSEWGKWETREALADWLQAHPEQYKRLVAEAAKRGNDAMSQLQAASVNNRAQLGRPWPDWTQDWQSLLRNHEAEVRANCPPWVLRELGRMGLGNFDLAGDTPMERLHSVLQDVALVQLAVDAIRQTPKRSDLPTVAEVAERERRHPLASPYLAALQLAPLGNGRPGLDEHGTKLALAFQFHVGGSSAWFDAMLETQPRLVADTLLEYCRTAFRHGNFPVAVFVDLGQKRHYATVAKSVALKLLAAFPPRCSADRLAALRHLLVAGLKHAPRGDLAELVRRKAALRSTTAAQRVHWLCCGVGFDPASHAASLMAALTGRGDYQRILCAIDLMNAGVLPVQCLDVEATAALVEHLGARCPPSSVGEGFFGSVVADAAKASAAVRRLIDHLASHAAPAATNAFEKLGKDAALATWQRHLRHAAGRQRETRREAEFQYATVAQVLDTLDGGSPANSADLAALTTDHLSQLAAQIARGNTSDWRQYWNFVDGRPDLPKDENLCRDSLLSDLRGRLPEGVDAEREGSYAGDRRADIRVSCKGLNVPVEIKRSRHRNLWSAIDTQLARYAEDPQASGYGIYLVFWFGREYCQRPPDGTTPETGQQLEDELRRRLTPEAAGRIDIVVVDVSDQKTRRGARCGR